MTYDYVLVGGGLQNALLSLAILGQRPGARIALLEREPSLGGNHTWSFYGGDMAEDTRGFLAPLITYQWAGHDVIFPNRRRAIERPYFSISSEQLDRVMRQRLRDAPGCALVTGADVRAVSASEAVLSDERKYRGRLVIDARGPERSAARGPLGYQKFVGLEVELSRPSELSRPIIMDATVAQRDGFRFLYTLPFTPVRHLLEDTYFSDTPELDVPRLRAGILAYAEERGLVVGRVLREEIGVLPCPLAAADEPSSTGPLVAGYQGGWFHPTTCYSVPVAARLARFVAQREPEQVRGEEWRAFVAEHRRQVRFCLALNSLLFRAYRPEHRWRVLEYFYRLPEPSIERFYALAMTASDHLRLFLHGYPRGFSLWGLLAHRGPEGAGRAAAQAAQEVRP